MIFRQLEAQASGALAYLMADANAQEAIVVDALPDLHAVVLALLDARGLRLRWVLRTHAHAGSDDGAAALCRRTGATLAAASCRTAPLRDGDSLAFGDEMIRVLATPGHTPDSVCFLWRDRLLSGDTLALGGWDRAPPPEADPARLYDSVTRRLFVLPGDTLVFPGHALHGRCVATIAGEREHNRAYAGRSRDAFLAAWRRAYGSANTMTAAVATPPRPSLAT